MRMEVRDLGVGKEAHDQRLELAAILQFGVQHVAGCIEGPQRDGTYADHLRNLIDHIKGLLRSLAHEDGMPRPVGCVSGLMLVVEKDGRITDVEVPYLDAVGGNRAYRSR